MTDTISPTPATVTDSAPPSEFAVKMDLLLKVTASEMSTWQPSVIERFFAGLAMAVDAAREGRKSR